MLLLEREKIAADTITDNLTKDVAALILETKRKPFVLVFQP